ncbi:MAG: 3-phosphoshikimate 1-carboxyvinyltransferase [Bacteroidales bacterium]
MKLIKKNSSFQASVKLSSGKSESNRALMIAAYSDKVLKINNISDADDTVLLQELLNKISLCNSDSEQIFEVYCKNAGTVFRFLLTYLAQFPGNWFLTGSERMKQRPVNDLVIALKELGAEIQFIENEGFPPLFIRGKKLSGGNVKVSISKSSQFATSLLLAAPCWEKGLLLELTGDPGSMPYIDMTISLMQKAGAVVERKDQIVIVQASAYQESEITVLPDWSGASYWLEMVALSKNGSVWMEGLSTASDHGDKEVLHFFEKLGVGFEESSYGIKVFQTGRIETDLRFDLKNFPDLMPALVASCAGLGVKAVFTGLENLGIKESDRISVLLGELAKAGFEGNQISSYSIETSGNNTLSAFPIQFDPHGDHRMAMCLAPLVLKLNEIDISDPEVVIKSYPGFWQELSATDAVIII